MKTTKTYFTGSRRIKYLLLTLLGLVVSDGVISQFLVRYGLGHEGNPFLQTFISEGNFLLVKLAGALLAVIILWDIHKKQPRVALIGTLSFVVLYTGIVFWNLGVFLITQI